jgi:hypothetical protein
MQMHTYNLKYWVLQLFTGEDLVSDRKIKPKPLTIMLILALAVFFTFQMNPVLANVPQVVSVQPYQHITDTLINVTIYHASPDSSHYVNLVELNIEGEGVEELPLSSQSEETFIAQFNIGVTDEYRMPYVTARATCTQHGSGDWSTAVIAPEFPTLSLLLVLAIVSIAALLFRSKR